jgi:hypothetical protein
MRATKMKRNEESKLALQLLVKSSPPRSIKTSHPHFPRVPESPQESSKSRRRRGSDAPPLHPNPHIDAAGIRRAPSFVHVSASFSQLMENTSSNAQGGAGSSVRAASPINLTPANNNVFNLKGDKMEHAIPEQQFTERTSLLGDTKAQGSKASYMSAEQSHALSQQDWNGREGLVAYHYLDDEHLAEGKAKWWQLLSTEVVVILLLYMVNKIGQELVISSIPLITREGFGWTQEGGGYYMAAVGASVLPMILLVNSLVRDLEERELVIRLSNACVLCLLVMLHVSIFGSYTLLQYIAGSALLFACLNALEGVIMSLLAKVISPELARGTFNSGLLATEAGTFGRVLGDFCITLFGVSHNAGDIVNRLFLPLVVMIVASSLLVWAFYDRFV